MKNFWNIGNGLCGLLILLVMLFLGGCANPDSAITKRYEIDQQTHTGDNILVLVLDADVESSSSVKQDAKADARTQIDAALSPVGKVGEAAAVAEDILEAGKRLPAAPKKEVVHPVEDPEDQKTVTEHGIYHGLTNGDRPTWYFSKNMDAYPLQFDVVIPGCKTLNVENNGVRDDQGGGYLVKQSDVSGRGMSVLAAKGCTSTVARI